MAGNKTSMEKVVECLATMRTEMAAIDAAYNRIAQALEASQHQGMQSQAYNMDTRYREFSFWAQMVAGMGMQDAAVAARISAAAAAPAPAGNGEGLKVL